MLLIREFLQTLQGAHTHAGIIVVDERVDQRLFDGLVGRLLGENFNGLQPRSRVVRIAKRAEQQIPDGIVFHLSLETKRLGNFAGQFDLSRYGIRIDHLKIRDRSIPQQRDLTILTGIACGLHWDWTLITDIYAEGQAHGDERC